VNVDGSRRLSHPEPYASPGRRRFVNDRPRVIGKPSANHRFAVMSQLGEAS